MSEPLRIFTHIPKTAGTTMLALIQKAYGRGEVTRVPTGLEDEAAFMRGVSPQTRILAGHHPYGLHRHTERPCSYFTVLRDPRERVLSLYYFVLRDEAHPSHRRVASGEETFVQVVESQDNIQTQFIAGPGPTGETAEERLRRAKAHLRAEFDVCGLMERFEESLLVLQSAYGWDLRGYASKNVTRNRPAARSVEPEILEAIERCNQSDWELYRLGQELFAAQMARQAPGFPERLEALRKRAARAARVQGAKDAVWRWVRGKR